MVPAEPIHVGSSQCRQSTFYRRPNRANQLQRARADTDLRILIEDVLAEFPAYGYRRVTQALKRQGEVVNHKRVARIMREHALTPRRVRDWMATTNSDHTQPVYPNLAQDIVPAGPDQLWVADLTAALPRGGLQPTASPLLTRLHATRGVREGSSSVKINRSIRSSPLYTGKGSLQRRGCLLPSFTLRHVREHVDRCSWPREGTRDRERSVWFGYRVGRALGTVAGVDISRTRDLRERLVRTRPPGAVRAGCLRIPCRPSRSQESRLRERIT